ncbi:MAG: hypothetical protein ABFD07_14255 [Methanobacterium sp.]
MEFPFICTIKPYLSTDIDHKKTFGTSFSSPCNFQQTNEIVNGTNGRESITYAFLVLPPETPLHKHDVITLPGGSEPYVRSFYSNYRPSDYDEIEYITVNLADNATGDDN